MKKALFLSLFALLFTSLRAQDIIIKSNGDEIQSKVIEIGNDEIRYKNFSNPNGPTYVIRKSEVFMIRYQNGGKDVFANTQQEQNNYNNQRNYNASNDSPLTYTSYNEVTMDGRKLTWAELDALLSKSSPQAYELFRTGRAKVSSGTADLVCGLAFIVSSVPFYLFNFYGSSYLAVGFDVVGTALFVSAFGIMEAGKARIRHAYDEYNNNITRNRNNVSLNFGITSTGGIGVALKF